MKQLIRTLKFYCRLIYIYAIHIHKTLLSQLSTKSILARPETIIQVITYTKLKFA